MKILYHHRTQAEDGQAVHIRALQRAFRELGHELVEHGLVSRDARAAGPARRSPWALLARSPRWVRELAEYSYGPLARGGLIRAGRELGADVLYERYAFGNTAGLSAARALRIPLVLEVNSPMVLELSRTRGLSMPRTAERLERHIFQSADLVCVVTEVLRGMLLEMGVDAARLLVTPNGVWPELYAHPDRPAARRALGLSDADTGCVLGFVGYYRDWHRLDLVLDALGDRALSDARVVLVGDGPARGDLERRARERGIAGRLHFVAARPHDEIPALLPAFDVALLPAINPYASPLKLYEYLAAGLAVLAPDQPNLRECLVDGENALLVPPADGAALTAVLSRLASDAALRARLGARARATIVERDLTWRGNARRVLEAVERLRGRA